MTARLALYQLDAFTNRLFSGNPAAVCPMDEWLDKSVLQNIAAENNLAETAFFVAKNDVYELRWFTPTTEMDLCGHATLASAHVIFNELGFAQSEIRFHTRSGPVRVIRDGELLSLDFPARSAQSCAAPPNLARALNIEIDEIFSTDDYMVVVKDAAAVEAIQPDFKQLAGIGRRGVIVTAPGDDCDFVSRFFAPRVGIDEDPVTGSAHCTLIPFWSKRSGKTKLHARQLSTRGGELFCEARGDRVLISGHVVMYLRGEINVVTG